MLDIATKLGVSVVTVSNALAGRDGVSETMRKKICETAEKMGYKPSNTKSEKKRLAIPKISKNVGILTSERFVGARGTFYWELTAGISNQLSQLNMCTVYECVTAESEKNGVLPNMVTENKIDGMIVIGQIHRNYIECLSKLTMPLMFVDFYDNRYKIDSVISDSFNGGYMLTDHLVSKGHRRIGFFGTLNATSSINDRYLGYVKCIMENKSRKQTYTSRTDCNYRVNGISSEHTAHHISHKSYSSADHRAEENACHLYRKSAEADTYCGGATGFLE